MLRKFVLLSALCAGFWAHADAALNFNFKDAELSKVIEEYAKATGQKFIVDAGLRGKVTILNKEPISNEEAFNQLSTALALNSYGISKQDDKMVVEQARAVQRDLLDVTPELPPMHPTKMATWVINLKYANADEVNKQLRILTSKDGELVPFIPRNQILVTDWTPNLHRIAKIIATIDTPATKTTPAPKPPEKATKAH